MTVKTGVKFFPLKWSIVCFALDLNLFQMRVVVDGELLGEQGFNKEEIFLSTIYLETSKILTTLECANIA